MLDYVGFRENTLMLFMERKQQSTCTMARVGGRGKFEHCGTCGLCVPTNHPHRCVQEASKANCPICMEVRNHLKKTKT